MNLILTGCFINLPFCRIWFHATCIRNIVINLETTIPSWTASWEKIRRKKETSLEMFFLFFSAYNNRRFGLLSADSVTSSASIVHKKSKRTNQCTQFFFHITTITQRYFSIRVHISVHKESSIYVYVCACAPVFKSIYT